MPGENTAIRIGLITSGVRHVSRLAIQTGVERTRLNRAILGQLDLNPAERAAVAAALDRDEVELFPSETVDV